MRPRTAVKAKAAAARSRRSLRVCIVYEHALFAHGIKRMLQTQHAVSVVGMLGRRSLAPRHLRERRPDVVVVESDEELALLECLEGLPVVAISLRAEDATLFTGHGARASCPEELAEAIRGMARRPRPAPGQRAAQRAAR